MGLGWREEGVCDGHNFALEDVAHLNNSKWRQQCRGRSEKGGAPLGRRLLCLREGRKETTKKGTYHEELDGGEGGAVAGVVRDLGLLVEGHCAREGGEREGWYETLVVARQMGYVLSTTTHHLDTYH